MKIPHNLTLNDRFLYLFWTISLVLIFHSCKIIQPNAPRKEAKTSNTIVPLSEINIPIEVSTAEIQELINNKVKGLLYEDKDLDNNNRDNLLLKVWKNSLITLEPIGNEIYYRIPIKIWAKAGFEFNNFGLNFSRFKEVESSVILKFKSTINIDSSWKMVLHTQPYGFEWEKKPVVKFGIFEFPLTIFVEKILKSQQLKLCNEFDDKAIEAFDLKSLVNNTWLTIQKPMQISKDPLIWGVVNPVDIQLSHVQGDRKIIKTVVSIKALLKGSTGKPPQQNLLPLPILSKSNSIKDTSHLNFLFNIGYTEINELLRKTMISKRYNFLKGRRKVIIKNINVYPSQNRLVFKIGIEGSVKGNIFIEGVPYYHSLSKSIRFRETDFALETKNILLKTSSWLVHSSFAKEIENNLVLPVTEYLSQYEEIINMNLNKLRISENIYLQGYLTDLTPQELTPLQDSISISINARGIINAKIDNLSK